MKSPLYNLMTCVWAVVVLGLAGCSVQDEPQSSLHNIFGTDDRVVAPDQYPYRAVGRLDSGCTGTLISDTLVLTGAHCVVDSGTGNVKANLGWFRPNLRGNDLQSPAAWIVRAWVGSQNPDGNRLRDFAVVELDSPLGNQFGKLAVRDFNIPSQVPFRTDLIGFSTDRDSGGTATLHRGCFVKEIVQDRLFHDCDGAAGVSGGPMLNSSGSTFYISAMTVSEFRQGAPGSVTRDTYTKEYANVAIPAKNFIGLTDELLATVAQGRPAPSLPDITLKINPTQRPGGGGGGGGVNYTVAQVTSESALSDNELVLSRMTDDLEYEARKITQWANSLNDQRLLRLARQAEDGINYLHNEITNTVRGRYNGQHRQPVFTAWKDLFLTLEDLRAYPRSSGRTALEDQMLRYLSQIDDIMRRAEAVIFD